MAIDNKIYHAATTTADTPGVFWGGTAFNIGTGGSTTWPSLGQNNDGTAQGIGGEQAQWVWEPNTWTGGGAWTLQPILDGQLHVPKPIPPAVLKWLEENNKDISHPKYVWGPDKGWVKNEDKEECFMTVEIDDG